MPNEQINPTVINRFWFSIKVVAPAGYLLRSPLRFAPGLETLGGRSMSGIYFNPEFLEDRVRFTYTVKQCDGVPDRDGVIEIIYSDFQNLPLLPEGAENWKGGINKYSVEKYYIPNINAVVAFIIVLLSLGEKQPLEICTTFGGHIKLNKNFQHL